VKPPFIVIAVSLCAVAVVRGQEADTPPPAAPGVRDAYLSTQLKDFPHDANGFLKPEIWDIVAAEAKLRPGTNEERILLERKVMKDFYATYKDWKAPEPTPVAPGKLRNLPDIPKTPRFPLTDKVWPEKTGDTSICLWEDDKLAAMSLGVDDNCATDLPYWKELSKKYGGLNITWNLIVDNIDGALEKGRGPMAGSWATWKEMLNEGYHLASHSMTHNHDPVPADGWPGPDWEAAESQHLIDSHLPGHKTRFLALPGSGVHAFGILSVGSVPFSTWRPSLVKYYAGARGAGGQALNQANMIDYFCIHATVAVGTILDNKDPKYAQYQIMNLFDADPKSRFHNFYRGWANIFIHFINNGKDFDKNPGTIAYGKMLGFYNDHRADLWTGYFDDVGLYAEERDTATVATNSASDKSIVFTLTDKMDPAMYDYPLTVKVRLPSTWKSTEAKQGGKTLASQVIAHEGASFALVKAMPDRGQVTLTPASAK